MLHWARSFFAMALIAALLALAPPLRALALLLICIFLALAMLALVTGAAGRRADGSYSAERALGTMVLLAALAAAGGAWLGSGWTAADAGRAIDQGFAQVAENVRR